ncbi:MAG: ABC transporter permease [Deltaproteobacteria bacterium]|nr:ABC transporter permease [Deltaproteobacteria bacterium]
MNQRRGSGLPAWVVRKVAGTVLVLLGTSLVLFVVARLAPGDAAVSLGLLSPDQAGPGAELRRQLGLDAPWIVQYGRWLAGVVRGDFGTSAALQMGRPVAELLWPAVRRSLSLTAAAVSLSAAVALGLALLRRARPFSRRLAVADAAAHLLSAVPVFLFAYALVAGGNAVVAWGVGRGAWPAPSWFPLPHRDSWVPWFLAVSVLAVGDGFFLDLYQRFRSELDHAGSGEHLVGARLLGLSVAAVVTRGFLPGAVSHLSRRTSFALGSLVVLESVLGWPGLGWLAWRAAAERDLPVLLGVALISALVVRLAVLAADAAWYAADPRSRT